MTLDHLVVIAPTLDAGVAWCEATLGITPGPGGEHPLMGTHNRLFKLATTAFPLAYFEIIAINKIATPAISTSAKRWFDMDSPALQAHIDRHGPQLAHWVARVPDITLAQAALADQGVDVGCIVQASRMTGNGLLQWRISVRDDGQRLFDGCLPTLIQWGDTHPTTPMPDSGVTLESLTLSHPQTVQLGQALEAMGMTNRMPLPVALGVAQITATLNTPRGRVVLRSGG